MDITQMARASVPMVAGIGVNAVPIAGTFWGGWPPETTMAVYILETALLVAVTALRLRLLAPERLVGLSGATQRRNEAIQGYVLFTGGLVLAFGLFSALVVGRKLDPELTWQAIRVSLPAMALWQGIGLLADLLLLRRANQALAERWMLPGLRRGCVLYGAAFLGAVVIQFNAAAFLYPFIALKLLFDLGGAAEEALVRLRTPLPYARTD
jgi:hypothetical protein